IVTMDFRETFQKKFGGNGAGFISINTDDIKMRKSTTLSFSNDWKEASLFKRNPNKWPFGMNAAVFVPAAKSWVKYETSRLSKTLTNFNTARLFYINQDNNASVKYTLGKETKTVKLDKSSEVKELIMKSGSPVNSVNIEFENASNSYFFGVSLENGNGVYVDNFPVKGNSGVSLIDIPANVLKDFNQLLNYKLIIINFGINVLSPEHNDYEWYARKMEKVINHFKSAFPNTSILLVTVGDKGVKRGSKFISDPGINMLLKAQKDVANKTGVAYWSLFDAMGGENSINGWVNAGPPLVFKDYAHLTYEGGAKVAELLSNALINEYNKK
ncbi:MAG: GDSL-type esterase/lipase family protein, partial [Syntrophothermus sp.]